MVLRHILLPRRTHSPNSTPSTIPSPARILVLRARHSRVRSSRPRGLAATYRHVLLRDTRLLAALPAIRLPVILERGRHITDRLTPCDRIPRLPAICRNGWLSIRTCP
jgi:hypothetical protein